MSVNRVTLVGNLGSAPQLKTLTNGNTLCRFSVATHEKFKTSTGELSEHTEWHTVTVWGKLAENCSKFLTKGSKVLVEGSLRTREWQTQEGAQRVTTEVVATSVEFLSKGSKEQQAAQPPPTDEEYKFGPGI